MADQITPLAGRSSCRNCRRPIAWVAEVQAWLHEELPQYAHQPITCLSAHPVTCGAARCDNPHTPGADDD